MILYLDTSAWVKLYVEEAGSTAVEREAERATAVVTVRIAYAEARAAFARLRRLRRLTLAELRRLVRALDEDWPSLGVVEVGEALVRRAGALAERHDLRAYDAIHLAAALELRRSGGDVGFASFDGRQSRAAARERLPLAIG